MTRKAYSSFQAIVNTAVTAMVAGATEEETVDRLFHVYGNVLEDSLDVILGAARAAAYRGSQLQEQKVFAEQGPLNAVPVIETERSWTVRVTYIDQHGEVQHRMIQGVVRPGDTVRNILTDVDAVVDTWNTQSNAGIDVFTADILYTI
jgi:hypothetical protein